MNDYTSPAENNTMTSRHMAKARGNNSTGNNPTLAHAIGEHPSGRTTTQELMTGTCLQEGTPGQCPLG